jgi:excisionase family DNA binding protein
MHELMTVDAAAERLQLHPKTVLRCIREGRLKAKKIGKSYRISRADVDAFAGVAAPVESPADARVTAIVDVPGARPELARDWGVKIPAALNSREAHDASVRADVIYDAERSRLKVVLVGGPADVTALLRAIELWIEQPREERT